MTSKNFLLSESYDVAIRLAFLVVLSKISFQSFCLAENFATIKAGSLPSGAHRLTVCSALKNWHILCGIEHFHFQEGMLTSCMHFLLNTLYHFITFLEGVAGALLEVLLNFC